jgi:hypothetical protein
MSWWHLVPWWLIVAALVLVLAVVFGHLPLRAAGILALMIALLFGGYRWGATTVDAAWQAKDAKRIAAAALASTAESIRADKASGALQAELLQHAIDNDQLQKAFNAYKRRSSILARRPLGPAAPAAAADQAQPASGQAQPAGNGVALSLGAVWMWNSALYQHDAPAGACGLSDTSEAACAADAGISLEDAWDNQALNARICAEDRLRHQRLIDYIRGGQKK